MTQKQIRQTIISALHCNTATANYCVQALYEHTPDSLRKAEEMKVRYYQYDDGTQNLGIILFSTKFNDDPQHWFFSVYLD